MARFRSVRNESGFALIEVIVSAAVLAMVALAVLSGIDGSTSASGRESARSVAASLAEQDQERLHSLQIDKLADYSDPAQTFTIGGITYTVKSATHWVRDDSGNVPSCTDKDKESDYVYVSSTVTTAGALGSRIPAVKLESIVAPPVKYSSSTGTLAVQVNNRDSKGVPNLTVSISGPSSDSALTNDAGCALFQYIPIGSYTVTLNRPGWVDRHAAPVSTATKVVTASTVNLLSMVYDQAASATLNVKTYTPGTTTAIASSSADISTINSAEAMRTFDPAGVTNVPSIAATNLFPFTTAYNFWTGNCSSENPETYSAGYFAPAGGKALPTDPGGIYTKDIFQPPVNLRVTRDSSGKLVGSSGARTPTVTATYLPPAKDAGCVDKVNLALAPVGTANGWVSQASTTTPATFDPGLPFGKWKICVWDGLAPTKRGFYFSYDNTAPGGQATTLDLTPDSNTYSSNQATIGSGTTAVTAQC